MMHKMSIEKRMMLCRLIDKMNSQESYSEKLGIVNTSRLHNRVISDKKSFCVAERQEWRYD